MAQQSQAHMAISFCSLQGVSGKKTYLVHLYYGQFELCLVLWPILYITMILEQVKEYCSVTSPKS